MEELANRGGLAVMYRDAAHRVMSYCAGEHLSVALARDISLISNRSGKTEIRLAGR
jgi:hypothetical protein